MKKKDVDWATDGDYFAASIAPSFQGIQQRVSVLCWQDEGGGFAFGYDEAMRMDLDTMDQFLSISYRWRKERAKAIEKARKGK